MTGELGVNTKSPNAIMLDSMTLQGALRLLACTEGIPRYSETEVERRRKDKWNYALNTGFRVASDISCLAQLVQSLILHEEIAVEASYMATKQTTYDPDDPLAPIPPMQLNQLLSGSVSTFSLSLASRLDHAAQACELVVDYAMSEAFKNYLKLLSVRSLDAAFLHISHAYFGTGYSDLALFPREEFAFALKKEVRAFRDYASLLDYTRYRTEDHVLARTPQSREDVDDKAGAAVDVLRNAQAAYFYQSISDSEGIGYLSHPLRSSFVAFDAMAVGHGLDYVGERILGLLQQGRAEAVTPVNELLGEEVIHVEIPFFLAAVLQNASAPEDVIERALAVRDSRDAKQMRSWLSQFREMLADGEMTVERQAREIARLKRLVAQWMDTSSRTTASAEQLNIGLNFGPVSVSKDVRVPGIRRTPKRLRLLQSLADVSNTTPRFNELIRKVFGVRVGDSWEHYRHALKKFQDVNFSAQDKRYSPLSLMIDRGEYEKLKTSDNQWDRLRAELAWTQVVRRSGVQSPEEFAKIIAMLIKGRPLRLEDDKNEEDSGPGTTIRMECGHVLPITDRRTIRWLTAEGELSYHCKECDAERLIVAVGEDTLSEAGQSRDNPHTPPPSRLVDDLERLTNLHASGALTDAEFQAAKSRLLGE